MSTHPRGDISGEVLVGDSAREPMVIRWFRVLVGPRVALAVFVVATAVTAPILMFGLGHYQWFQIDDWTALSTRTPLTIHHLFDEYNGHWVTLPVLLFNVVWPVFKLTSYRPYQALTVAAHLSVISLVRVVLRRNGVSPWTATLGAASLLLLGTGAADLVQAWQISFTLPLAFGLAYVVATDHDGSWNRRDWLGIAFGLAALMSSDIGVVMVVIVGIVVAMRRGPKIAVAHVVPLGLLMLGWLATYGRTRPGEPTLPHQHLHAVPGDMKRVIWNALRGVGGLEGTRTTVVAMGLVSVAVVGAAFTLVQHRKWGDLRRSAAVPVGLTCGALMFAAMVSVGRGSFGKGSLFVDRYVYVFAVLLVPVAVISAQRIVVAKRSGALVCLVLLATGVPGNVRAFGSGLFGQAFVESSRHVVLTVARQPGVARLPPRSLPYLFGPTAGFMVDGVREGWMPRLVPPADSALTTLAAFQVALVQSGPGEVGRRCGPARTSEKLHLSRGATFVFQVDEQDGQSPLNASITATRIGAGGEMGAVLTFSQLFGSQLTAYADHLDVVLSASPSTTFRRCKPT